MKLFHRLAAAALIAGSAVTALPSAASAGTTVSVGFHSYDYGDRYGRDRDWRDRDWRDRREWREREWHHHHRWRNDDGRVWRSGWRGDDRRWRDRCWTEWRYSRYEGERVPVRICH